MKKEIFITAEIEIEFTKEMIKDLFISACEGGSSYWCLEVKPLKDKGDAYDSMFSGWKFLHDSKTNWGLVTKHDIERGTQIFARKHPKRALSVIEENYDAEDADIFFQYCCFGEVIYG